MTRFLEGKLLAVNMVAQTEECYEERKRPIFREDKQGPPSGPTRVNGDRRRRRRGIVDVRCSPFPKRR